MNPDFFYIPLIFLRELQCSSGSTRNWNGQDQDALGLEDVDRRAGQSEMHVLPITSLNDRGFDAFTFNPLSSPKPDFYPIDVVDIYTEVKWYFPKIKSGQMLAVPLSNGPKPICAYFVKDISRQCEQVDYGSVW